MRMFTKIGVTLATGAVPVLLWAGAAGAQQSGQSQSQSGSQATTTPATNPVTTNFGGGNLARTGADDLLPLALGGAALGGAVAVRRGLRRRSPA